MRHRSMPARRMRWGNGRPGVQTSMSSTEFRRFTAQKLQTKTDEHEHPTSCRQYTTRKAVERTFPPCLSLNYLCPACRRHNRCQSPATALLLLGLTVLGGQCRCCSRPALLWRECIAAARGFGLGRIWMGLERAKRVLDGGGGRRGVATVEVS